MFTSRNKMIVALILAAVVAFTAYTMYAKSCACKKAAKEEVKATPKTAVVTMPEAEKPVVPQKDIPEPVLA